MAIVLAAFMPAAATAMPHAQMAQAGETQADEPQVTRTQHQDWGSVCFTRNGATRCDIQQVVTAEMPDGARLTLQVALAIQDGTRMMELALPLAMDLRAGVVLKIDDGPEIPHRYATCIAQSCVVLLAVDDQMMAALRAGELMRVGFRPFGVDRTLVLDVSLLGFTRASERLR